MCFYFFLNETVLLVRKYADIAYSSSPESCSVFFK